jgi:hypothetical protein
MLSPSPSIAFRRLTSTQARHLSAQAERIRKIQNSFHITKYQKHDKKLRIRKIELDGTVPLPYSTKRLNLERPEEQRTVVADTMTDMQKIHTDKAFPGMLPFLQ